MALRKNQHYYSAARASDQRDERRTVRLESRGITIVRIPAKEVLNDPLQVAEAIAALCRRAGQ